ncbi:hypothetical protein BGZ83_004221 [Gryganskiella cystojenkinii]|nr:hypothetical protein BGZ83_004221 [Gryganskiella cystojenkinii]
MAFYAQDNHETDADTDTLLQCSSTSSSLSCKVIDSEDDGYKTCSGRACCSLKGRQLATPLTFFAHDDVADWMQTFEEIARANNWNSSDKLDIIPIYMGGKSVKAWFRQNQHKWDDFEMFKSAFDKRFGKKALEQMVNVEVKRWKRLALGFAISNLIFMVIAPLIIAAHDDMRGKKCSAQ